MKSITQEIIDCFQKGNKLLIVGNGGSAAMSQETAAEFIGKFEKDRQPLPALALTTDSSILTALPNDYPWGFNEIFARQIQALGKKGDILLIFSTSGRSKNCLRAIEEAEQMNIKVIEAPRIGDSTAHIQEYQHKWMHDIVRQVELYFV